MKIDLSEIWNFMSLVPMPNGSPEKICWSYKLIAGEFSSESLLAEDIRQLKKDEGFDVELLPSVFTFREILWQPNVYTRASLYIPQLNMLRMFCEEYIDEREAQKNNLNRLYLHLLNGLAALCQESLDQISSREKLRVASILGDLRKRAFPIIKFFIRHPMNKTQYIIDAQNRLNYAVKIMLTQYNNKYDELEEPFWQVTKKEMIETPAQEWERETHRLEAHSDNTNR